MLYAWGGVGAGVGLGMGRFDPGGGPAAGSFLLLIGSVHATTAVKTLIIKSALRISILYSLRPLPLNPECFSEIKPYLRAVLW